MSTDLEADLRREFDTVGAPSGLTFSPESVLRQGNRTIRRHRIIAAGSAAMAVVLVAGGAALTRPHDTAVCPQATPQRPASSWGNWDTSGTLRGPLPAATPQSRPHVHYSVITQTGTGKKLGVSSHQGRSEARCHLGIRHGRQTPGRPRLCRYPGRCADHRVRRWRSRTPSGPKSSTHRLHGVLRQVLGVAVDEARHPRRSRASGGTGTQGSWTASATATS